MLQIFYANLMLYELDIRNCLIIAYLVIYDKFVHVAYMWMAGCSVDFLRDISFILHNPFLIMRIVVLPLVQKYEAYFDCPSSIFYRKLPAQYFMSSCKIAKHKVLLNMNPMATIVCHMTMVFLA